MIAKYIGIPFIRGGRDMSTDGGLDCYGLCTLFYKNEFGIILPDHRDINTNISDYNKCADAMLQQSTYDDFVLVGKPKYGDLILMNVGGFPAHIGIFIEDNLMLHTNERSGSVIENYMGVKWKQKLQGLYRHKRFQVI